jgi:hypothetical protein
MRIPYRCPVCDGKGLVPNGFYRAVGMNEWGSSSASPETCRTCKGIGIIWSDDYNWSYPTFPPDNADTTDTEPNPDEPIS